MASSSNLLLKTASSRFNPLVTEDLIESRLYKPWKIRRPPLECFPMQIPVAIRKESVKVRTKMAKVSAESALHKEKKIPLKLMGTMVADPI